MVCLGNICRSPLAEGILRNKLPEKKFTIDSAGTANYHVGSNPDYRSIEVAKRNGIDISKLKARQFSVIDFDLFDIIYAMDKSNFENIIKLARNNSDINKVKLLLNETVSNVKNVPDPYYGSINDFEDLYIILNSALKEIASNLTH